MSQIKIVFFDIDGTLVKYSAISNLDEQLLKDEYTWIRENMFNDVYDRYNKYGEIADLLNRANRRKKNG